MTIRLLCAYDKYPTNAIVTLDTATEQGLILAKQASANTAGGTPWVPPTVPNQLRPATLVIDPSGAVLGLAGPNNTIIPIGGGAAKPATPAAPVLTALTAAISVAYTAPSDGGSAILEAQFTDINGVSTTLTGSPQTIAKTAGAAITGAVRFRNAIGWSDYSPQSNQVTPTAPVTTSAASKAFNGSAFNANF